MSELLFSRPDVGEFRKRYKYLAIVVLAAFGVVVARLFQLQIVEGVDYAVMAHENIIRRVSIATTRGVIRDTRGKILASSRPSYAVYVVPGRVMPSARPLRRGLPVTDEPDSWPRIADALRLTPAERQRIEAKIKGYCVADDDRSPCWRRKLLVREDAPRDIVAELRQHQAELAGAEVMSTPVRYFPFKQLGSHMVGYVSEIDVEALSKLRPEGYEKLPADERRNLNPLNYGAGDVIGATGVEHAWESYLRGQHGWEKRVVDAHGRYRTGPEAERHLDPPVRQEPIAGRDLRLTVDVELLTAIERAMAPHASGAVVAVEVRTGRILALYSKPDFDANDLSGGAGRTLIRETFNRLYANPLHPMLDKTMSGAFHPGSTFKPFSALAGLEENLLRPESTERCNGYLVFGRRVFRCTHVHGTVNLRHAIGESCNVYFFKVGETVGMDRIAKLAMEFGLGAKTGLGINPESPGRIPTRAWYALRQHGQFRIGFTLNTAIGQGDVNVTPLQLALGYAALGNGGTLYHPQIVQAVEAGDGSVIQTFPPRVRRQIAVKPQNLSRVADGLWAVVNEPKGTAYPVRDPALDVAGKTGTAQTGYVPRDEDDPKLRWYYAREHAWFAAFSPSKAPEVAVVVLIEHGGSGPTQAAPVAMQVIREYHRLFGAHPAKPASKPPPSGGHP